MSLAFGEDHEFREVILSFWRLFFFGFFPWFICRGWGALLKFCKYFCHLRILSSVFLELCSGICTYAVLVMAYFCAFACWWHSWDANSQVIDAEVYYCRPREAINVSFNFAKQAKLSFIADDLRQSSFTFLNCGGFCRWLMGIQGYSNGPLQSRWEY